MKSLTTLCLCFFIQAGIAYAAPTAKREWTAISGHKTMARALSTTSTVVTLELEPGKSVQLGLDKLIPADREFLLNHFHIKAAPAAAADEPQRSGEAAIEQANAPHPLGQITGPIKSAPGSSYHIYVSKSLKQGRKAPLLHFNGAGGYQAHLVQRYLRGIERFGWIMVASVESKNATHGAVNLKHAANNIARMKESPLVDPDRIYFTGHSGGGAMSWWNAANLNAAGTMPVMSYIPPEAKISKGHHFVLIGATDYNRYHSGLAAATFKNDAFLRAYPGGHAYPSPAEGHIFDEGIAWLTAKYLEKNSRNKDYAAERLDFESAMLDWIKELTPTNPHQAYHLTHLLSDTYRITGKNAAILLTMQSKLAAEASHKTYRAGIEEIHQFGVETLSNVSLADSTKGHLSKDVSNKAQRLAKKYEGIPFVEETFVELAKPTVK
jgi:dienelactone hydrolase